MTLQDIQPATDTAPGDLAATAEFEAGLAELMPLLRSFARSLCGKRELAEDLAQCALAKALRSRRSFTLGTNLKAWLFTILRNEYYSYQRSAWRQTPWDPALAETVAAPPQEQLWAAELSDTTCAMNGLPDAQRKALILVGVGGFSYEDAAVALGSTVGTVKSRVGRGRQALKEILASHESRRGNSRPAKGNAMNEILTQLSHLIGASRATGTMPMHAGV